MNKHADVDPDLPPAWTDFSYGLNRSQFENLLTWPEGVTIYLDGKPAAVIISAEKYQLLMEELNGVLDS